MKKSTEVLRFGALFAGLCFLANPNVHILDVLPDAIGYLLLLFAIYKLSDLCEAVEDAKRAFCRLFWISLSKLPALLLLTALISRNVGEQVSSLTVAFVYAVAETVYGIRAFRLLFDGFGEVGMREDGGEFLYILPQRARKKTRRVDRLFVLTAAFLLVKQALAVLPETVYLVDYDSTGYITLQSQLFSQYHALLVGMAALVVLIFGIVWLCAMGGYVRHLRREQAFWQRLGEQYTEKIVPKVGLFALRRIKLFSALISVGMAFAVDMYFDEVNCLPDFVAAICFFLAALAVRRDASAAAIKTFSVLSIVYFFSGIATFITMKQFTSQFRYRAVLNPLREGAKELYAPYAICNACQQVLFVLVMLALCRIIRQIVARHTGVQTLTATSSSHQPLGKVYARRTVTTTALTLASAIMSTLYFWLVIDVQLVPDSEYTLYFPKFEATWMVDFALALILCVQVINLLYDLCGEVRYQYSFE